MFDFQRITDVTFFFFKSAWRMASWNFPNWETNSADKQPAHSQITQSGQGGHGTWASWLPASLSNKRLTLLKRWHFSSLFINCQRNIYHEVQTKEALERDVFLWAFQNWKHTSQTSPTPPVSWLSPSAISRVPFSRTGAPKEDRCWGKLGLAGPG